MVKCADCGFLACRNISTRQLEETERDGKGDIRYMSIQQIQHSFTTLYPMHETPICFANAVDLRSQYALAEAETGQEDALKQKVGKVITQERDCTGFVKWHQGFTPKEHQEMIDRTEILKWQAEREEADKKWRVEQEARHSKEEWSRSTFVAIITVAATCIGVILAWLLAINSQIVK